MLGGNWMEKSSESGKLMGTGHFGRSAV